MTENELAQIKKLIDESKAKDAACPHCGACQHCGRGGNTITYPLYPQPWYQPWYQPPYYITYTDGGAETFCDPSNAVTSGSAFIGAHWQQ